MQFRFNRNIQSSFKLDNMVQFKFENYGKRTPAHWKLIGDTALYSIPIIDSLLMAMPEVEHKAWFVWGWAVLASCIKIATKYMNDVTEKKEDVTDDKN